MKIIFLFLDGVGLGTVARSNPFYYTPTPNLTSMLGGNLFTRETAGYKSAHCALLPLDATLGVAGLPQSATGQASLFSGANVAKLLGRHVNGLPGKTIKEHLANHSMFIQLIKKGYSCAFLNGYRPRFFEKLRRGDFRGFSCSTLTTYYAGLPFRSLKDVEAGRALYADITNSHLRNMGFQLPVISAAEAAHRLVALSQCYDLVLFEHFLTDLTGHLADAASASRSVALVDAFLGGIVKHLPEDTMLFLSSDHGNLESDLNKAHTLNPVPALFYGPFEDNLIGCMKDLTHVLPALIAHLDLNLDNKVKNLPR